MRSSLLLAALVLVAMVVMAAAISAPPVFEHKADRDFKGTNCEVCQLCVSDARKSLGSTRSQQSASAVRLSAAISSQPVIDVSCSQILN